MPSRSGKKFFERRRGALEKERSSFISHWKEMSEYIQPRRGRFFVQDRNKGDRRHNKIINSSATQALKIARAGLMSGVMSPSRPWFELAPYDSNLSESAEVRVWMDEVRRRMLIILNGSNLYNMAPVMMSELLLFGTGAMTHVDDDVNVARFYTHPVGSYLIGQNERYEINTFIREFDMTVEQIVGEFGLDNVSNEIKRSYDKGDYDHWHTVIQYIGDNPNSSTLNVSNTSMPIISVYYEKGERDHDKILRTSGFNEFPVYVPRWDLAGEDVYGTDSPGMIALGDVKQLQMEERRKAQAIDKMVNPPLRGPASLRNVPVSSLPGGLTLYDSDVSREGLSPIYQVEPRINELQMDIHAIERRIGEAFFSDLFFAISQMEGIQPRNQLELTQRNQERLLQLGPVLERLHSEFLNKMINRTFNQLVRRDLIPPPPPELEGTELEVQFVSTLAMAQRSAAVGAIDDLSLYVGQLAQLNPDVLDKIDFDQAVDERSLITGVPPKVIRSDEQVAQIREQRQQQMQEQMMAQAAMAAAGQMGGTNGPSG